jgi:hypothetical protein
LHGFTSCIFYSPFQGFWYEVIPVGLEMSRGVENGSQVLGSTFRAKEKEGI